jgi:tRNA/tmRNA/rRNA uracil-C5-methylase (TrmA/RlmC/RlmD family)
VVELTAGPWGNGGVCASRVPGEPVVLVSGAIPGERLRVLITEARRGFRMGAAVQVLEASPDRVAPPWPEGAALGVTDLGHVAPAAARAAKAEVLAGLMRHEAQVDLDVPVEPVGDGGQLGWRTKIEFSVDQEGRVGMHGKGSGLVTPLASMPLAVPEIEALGLFGRRWPAGGRLTAVAPSDGEAFYLMEGRHGSPRRELVRVAGRDYSFELAAGGFWQLHRAAPALLALEVLAAVGGSAPGAGSAADAGARSTDGGSAGGASAVSLGERSRECAAAAGAGALSAGERSSEGAGSGAAGARLDGMRVWDLYAGAGLFTLPLAAAGAQVTAVEGDPRAASDLRVNARRAGLRLGGTHAADVGAALRRGIGGGRPHAVVLDPPRSGATRDAVEAVAAVGPDRIVYVACEPAALARDVARLGAAGFGLTELRAWDLFPGTHHLEALAVLDGR